MDQGDEYGAWPRRLLHVKSMTSFPWQPGNVYNGCRSPSYSAISYTWGRFAFRPEDPRYASVQPLPIKGTHWSDFLPRMDPDHFTNDEILNILRTAVQPCGSLVREEFIWLDVACIDQNPDSADYYREIGRQAKIFRGATRVYAWLTTAKRAKLEQIETDLADILDKPLTSPLTRGRGALPDKSLSIDWYDRAKRIVDEYTQDPWFTSLWTLQEAFLSPYAIMLGRKGPTRKTQQWLEMSRSKGLWPAQLNHLIKAFHYLRFEIQNTLESTGDSRCQSLIQDLDRIGFLDAVYLQQEWHFAHVPAAPKGTQGNPFSLLTASHLRQCSRPTDRVYGIMQIFELQLGRSRPGMEQADFSLEDLTFALGAELIMRYPVASQLIVQHSGCPQGQAWRVHANSTLAEESHDFWRHITHIYDGPEEGPIDADRRGAFLATQGRTKDRLGSFSGYCTTIETFFSVFDFRSRASVLRVSLDAPWDTVFPRRGLFSLDQVTKGQLLEVRKAYSNVLILLLSRIEPPSGRDGSSFYDNVTFKNWGIGLLLAEAEGQSHWKRLGTMIWDIGAVQYVPLPFQPSSLDIINDVKLVNTRQIPNAVEYIHGRGEGWEWKTGHFG
ncbi:hypothetical protein BJ166DRAFT_109548 [Pestalotiopsis sp. NC0098]|nr:hypothetical protein BJ166DRAFT_109548 [Pestalotiopsis sp. NC0098]